MPEVAEGISAVLNPSDIVLGQTLRQEEGDGESLGQEGVQRLDVARHDDLEAAAVLGVMHYGKVLCERRREVAQRGVPCAHGEGKGQSP